MSDGLHDTTRDGWKNKLEYILLAQFRPFWSFVNRYRWLARIVNRIIVYSSVMKAPYRPLALSTMADYTSWASLTDQTWFTRYLPSKDQKGLPDLETVARLFEIPDGQKGRESQRSTLLFPAFAQWFTDGFLLTDPDCRRRTRTNHQIDLSQVYGSTPVQTKALRLNSEDAGKKGLLQSEVSASGEWSPRLFDGGTGVKKCIFANVPDPLKLPELPLDRKATIFAFGGERANSNLYTAAMSTLFLREHNRLCALIETNNPHWDDERVFQVARNINIVQLIKVVVEEYINHISPYWFKLLADPAVCYTADWNRPNWIPVEFNLLYRWHSIVPDQAVWAGKPIAMWSTQFDNSRLLEDGLGAALASASESPASRLGLFNTAPFMSEVEKASIRQGRDNGLDGYNAYRSTMRFPKVETFEQISGDPVIVAALKKVYTSVDRLEFFPGLFAEDLPPRAAVPSLIGRMVAADAFSHALTNPLLSPHVFNHETFTREGMRCIEATSTLKDILARNETLEADAFISMDRRNYDSIA